MIVLVDCYIVKKTDEREFSIELDYLSKAPITPIADKLEVACTYFDVEKKTFHTYVFKSMYVDRDDVGGLGHMVIAPEAGAEQLKRLLATRDALNELFPKEAQ